jgi:ribosomal protein L37E
MKEYASQALKKLSPANSNNSFLRPDFDTRSSQLTVVSKLSSEGQSTPQDSEGEKAELGPTETLKCKKCGSTSFKARNTKDGEQKKLTCQRCGTVAA